VPKASLVIATYQRPAALESTLRSVLLQDEPDWEAIVVGDQCGAETAEVIRLIGDPRIRYYNLPKRCGEQSGPNTFGMHLATGDTIAFLNHDDLMLPDHLSHALGHRTDFYLGRFANATELKTEEDQLVPVYTALLPRDDDLTRLMTPHAYAFDPSSFWLIRTSYALAVGPWRAAGRLRRTPLQDWLLRAWRHGGEFRLGRRLTGLRFWTHNLRQDTAVFSVATPEHKLTIERLEREPLDDFRQDVLDMIDAAGSASRAKWEPPSPSDQRVQAWLVRRRRLEAGLYLRTGIDARTVWSWLRRERRADLMKTLLVKRTGEDLPSTFDIRPFLDQPEALRVV